jgi:DNA-binding NtrC family response regulator
LKRVEEIIGSHAGGEAMPEKENDQPARIRILLVDDEEGFANVLSNRLVKRGMDVRMAFSGSAAIQTLRRQDFDVAVLDLKMEDMDGIEVLKIFKKMDPKMPVIMLTGHGSEQAAREGMECGAIDYLTKPCELEDLIKKIREAVRPGR